MIALLFLASGCSEPAGAHVVTPTEAEVAAQAAVAPVDTRHAPSVPVDGPHGPPSAVVDLASDESASLVNASWRYVDAEIAEVAFRAPGPDRRPSGPPNRTHTLRPLPSDGDWNEAAWQPIAASALEERRGSGRLSFAWYRTAVELPERIGETQIAGSTVVFEIVVDDYAEVFVDGELAPLLGERGRGVIAGFNAPNRVVLTRDAQPSQRFDVAVLAANGPFALSPENYVWVRSAVLDVYAPSPAEEREPIATLERLDPRLDSILRDASSVELLATGFEFIEGPAWTGDSLLFSDPNANRIYRYQPDGRVSVFRSHSGYRGADIARYHQPGSNGLAVDVEGRIAICEHGNRRVTRLERNGTLTVLADRFEGKRLNSPNDLRYAADGALWFTDPVFGLPQHEDDPARELDFAGVFRLAPDGTLTAPIRDLRGPNGLAFSPDGRFLYVGDWDEQHKVVTRYPLDGSTVGTGEVFLDLGSERGEEAIDGVEVDRHGNVFVSGPGGLWIVAPDRTRLGVLRMPELPANMEWGDDGRTLYLTARTGLYRVRTATGR